MNRKGQMKSGTVILILVLLGAAWYFGLFDKLSGTPGTGTPAPNAGLCPDTQKTAMYINTQKALVTTATSAPATAYVYDDTGKLLSSNSVTSASSSFDVPCGKTYKVLVVNETTATGFYAEKFDIVAEGASKTYNKELYTFGQMKIVNIKNPVDPAGLANISSAIGANKDFVIQMTVNQTTSGYNRPLILCKANISSVTSITLGGGVITASAPARISATSGYKYYAWELPRMVKSTDALIELSGKIQFSSSIAPSGTDTMTCKVVDQAAWKKSNYQVLTLDSGWVESAENSETLADVGAMDSNTGTLNFNNAGGY